MAIAVILSHSGHTYYSHVHREDVHSLSKDGGSALFCNFYRLEVPEHALGGVPLGCIYAIHVHVHACFQLCACM